MGLSDSMAKITAFTSKLTSFTPSSLTANIPATSFTKALGLDGDYSFNSITDIKNSISELKERMGTAASLTYCTAIVAYHTFTGSNIGGIGAVLRNMATGAMGIIAEIWQQIADAVAAQVGMVVGQIVGTIVNLVSALQNLVVSIATLATAIGNMFKDWFDWSKFNIQLEIEAENCKDMLSAIAACYLNKLLGPYIEQFTSKVVGKINEVGNNFNELLYDEFQDINMFTSYSNQEAFLLQKASLQIKGLTKENLLDYSASKI